MKNNNEETKVSQVLHSIWWLAAGTVLSVLVIAIGIREAASGYHFDIEGMRVAVGGRFARSLMILPGLIGLIFGICYLLAIPMAKKRTQPFRKGDLRRDTRIINLVMLIIILFAFALFLFSFTQDYDVKIYNGTATVGDDVSYIRTTLNDLYSKDELSSYLRGWSSNIDSQADIRRIIIGSRFG